jgi:cell division protein FtsA
MTRDIAILDFGSGRISALVGRRGVNGTLDIAGSAEAQYAGFEDGWFLRPELLPAAVDSVLAAAERNAGVKLKHLFIGVPAEFSTCVVREASLGLGKKRRVTEADLNALFDAGDDFSAMAEGFTLINRQPVYYSLEDERRIIDPVGKVSAKLSGLMSYILAENKFTNFIDNIVSNLGIETAEYISAPLAEAMFLLDDVRRDRYAVLVDIGFITSFVAVVRGDGLLALSSFSMGGGHIAGDLTRYFGVSYNEAESLKRKVMVSLQPATDDVYEVRGKQFDAGMVNKIVTARLSVIAKNVDKCIKQCRYEIPSSASYCLTGGGISYMRGAREILAQFIGKELEPVSPPLPQMEKPELSSALGLLNMTLDADMPETKKKQGFLAKLFGR